MGRKFTKTAIAGTINISVAIFEKYIRHGFISGSEPKLPKEKHRPKGVEPGPCCRRKFQLLSLGEAIVAKALTAMEYRVPKIRELMKAITPNDFRDIAMEPKKRALLIVGGEKVEVIKDGLKVAALQEKVKEHGEVTAISLKDVIEPPKSGTSPTKPTPPVAKAKGALAPVKRQKATA